MGGKPVVRMNSAGKVVTDNGNILLDVAGLDFSEPVRLERDLKMPGVVENGVFALKTPQVVIAGKAGKAEIIRDVRKPA
jgi:ribose 5-phosphate isomerase A